MSKKEIIKERIGAIRDGIRSADIDDEYRLMALEKLDPDEGDPPT